MIHISKSPLRVSLIGGGTDFPSYFKKKRGAVISFTIDKYVYVIVKDKFDKKIKLSYSSNELPKNVDSIRHKLIKHIFKYFKIKDNIEFISLADIHSKGTGLGSSSAFTLSSLASINSYLKYKKPNKKDLANQACKIEIELNKSPIGVQDQFASSYGGFNFIEFKDSNVSVRKLPLTISDINYLNNRLVLFNTNISRQTNTILSNHLNNILTNKNLEYLDQLYEETLILKKHLINKNFDYIPKSLNKSWELKRKFNKKTNNIVIERLINKGINCGASGAKLLGAGKGGFILFYVDNNKKNKFINLMGPQNFVNYKFDMFGTTTLKQL